MGQEPERDVPGLDPAGIATRVHLEEAARARTAAEFEATYRAPALWFLGDARPAAGASDSSTGSGVQILTITSSDSKQGEAARYADRVAFVTKRPGNPFPHMVSIGRVATNDVVLALETVSKLHGYFLRDGDGWVYTDYRSTNGSLVNGRPVAKGERVALKDGDVLRFGTELEAIFLSPATLHARLRGERA